MSISVQSISKLYGEQKALDNVSLEVKPGEILGFLGPNGAGKSTLMKIVTGFIPPSSGQAFVCGLNTLDEEQEVKKKIGYLPELNPLYKDMYVKEFLLFVAGIHKIKNRIPRVKEMITKVGLDREQDKKIGALSKGYKQRVGLAQALIHDPEVLILDEPTTGLDPNQISDIRELIKELGKEKTVMLSTHIMQEVEAICNRVVIINKGQIVANEAVKNLKTISTNQTTLTVQFDTAISPNTLQKLDGIIGVEELPEFTYKIHCKGDKDIRKELNGYTIKHKISILSLSKDEKSLEDVFKNLTSERDSA